MIRSKIIYAAGAIFFLAFFMLGACKKGWEDHNAITDQALNKTLVQQISETSDLSIFYSYLVKSGYDIVLGSSNSFTVWAPNNTAMQAIDPTIIADTGKLKKFVRNHISYQAYFVRMPQPSLKIRTLSGKNITFTATTFDDANIVKADVYVNNGVLHTIDVASAPKPNAYEYLLSSVAGKQKAFLQSLFHTEVDTSKGVRLYVDPATGKPVYQAGTTFPVVKNSYFQKVADISSEDSLVTYIILNDQAYDNERNKIGKYYNVSTSATITDTVTQFAITKDLVINRVYNINSLPDSMVSTTGVKIHLDKSAIVETRQLSNGIAYVVNNISYTMFQNKIPVITLQGESLDSLRIPSAYTIKTKKAPNGVKYTDIQNTSITSSPDPLYFYRYKTVATTAKYQVYWRAVNDILTTSFNMKVDFSPTARYPRAAETQLATLGYMPSGILNYNEVYLGTYTPANYGTLYTFLVSATGVTSTAPTALSLDYIKLVPVN
ncbi:fasciclin domain-containing protein [Mucilaginibacter sp. HMF5004]|uniref:fasciclin domain-containing protein n=1 Tax=Mucilaginibacter rivuli TaxID=2857527 RepID=UPI001C5DC418|nr:fasciclin domain-containing protein [Mucilaginibacter rivuli]MBW4889952.1 fasciclin domain-containing protein [Mucilaginibacter rivuli]